MCGDNDTCRCFAYAVPLAVALWWCAYLVVASLFGG